MLSKSTETTKKLFAWLWFYSNLYYIAFKYSKFCHMEQENSNQKENYSLIKVNDGAIVQAYSNQNKEEKAKELSDQLASQDKETDSEKQVDFVFVEEEKNTGSYLVVSNNDLTTIEKDNKITNEQSFLPALIDEEVSLHVVDNSNKNEIENKQLFF